jgi:CBS domain-containing protein
MKCPDCGHEYVAGDDTCDNCGADLSKLDDAEGRSAIAQDLLDKPLSWLKMEPPLMVGLNTPLYEVVALLASKCAGAVLVTHEGALLGIFSERDLLLKVGDRYEQLKDEPVRKYMTPNPETLSSDDPIAFALNRMDVGHYRHVPVVDDGTPVGLISIRNILRQFRQYYPEVLGV